MSGSEAVLALARCAVSRPYRVADNVSPEAKRNRVIALFSTVTKIKSGSIGITRCQPGWFCHFGSRFMSPLRLRHPSARAL